MPLITNSRSGLTLESSMEVYREDIRRYYYAIEYIDFFFFFILIVNSIGTS